MYIILFTSKTLFAIFELFFFKENTDYTETNTSCTATLSDPDGWLGNTTFQIINSNANAEKILVGFLYVVISFLFCS